MSEAANCKKCDFPVTDNFCANCGQEVKVQPINAAYAKQELLHLAGYEKGILFTFRKLLVAPGDTILKYLEGNRWAIAKPVTFLFVTSVIYSLVAHTFRTEYAYESEFKQVFDKSSVLVVTKWIDENYGYANILMMLFIAASLRLFFRNRPYNWFETLAMLCFIMGEAMVLLMLHPILVYVTSIQWLESVVLTIAFLYISWALGQFYGGRAKDYIKAFVAYFLGFLVFEACAILGAMAFDALK